MTAPPKHDLIYARLTGEYERNLRTTLLIAIHKLCCSTTGAFWFFNRSGMSAAQPEHFIGFWRRLLPRPSGYLPRLEIKT